MIGLLIGGLGFGEAFQSVVYLFKLKILSPQNGDFCVRRVGGMILDKDQMMGKLLG